MNIIQNYIDFVKDNPEKTGELVKLSVKRFENDLKRKDITFDWDYAIDLIETAEKILCFWEGEWAGKPVKIYPFQAFIIGNLFGWKLKDGSRRFKSSYIQIARKNGKTTLLDIIIFIHLLLDDENTPQVLVGANNEEQAKICTTSLCKMIINSPLLKSRVTNKKIMLFRYGMQYLGLNWLADGKDGMVKAMSADAETKDGFNPSMGVVDEFHESEHMKMINVMRSGMVLRPNRMLNVITTAGFNKNLPCYSQLRKLSVNILNGTQKEDSHFAMIYEMNADDDWMIESNWVKPNPMSEHIPSIVNYLRDEYQNAINMGGTQEVAFRTKNLNQWTDSEVTWIAANVIKQNNHGTKDADLIGKECYVGIDLSKSKDLSVALFLFPLDGRFVTKVLCFIPESKLRSHEDNVDYVRWRNEGWVIVHEGNVLDHNKMGETILNECQKYDLASIGFDSKYAYQGVVTTLAQNGYEELLMPVGQGFNLSAAYVAIEGHAERFEFDFMNNPVTAWNFSNVEMITGNKGDIMASKGKSKNKIDIVTSLATAYTEYLRLKRDVPTETGIFFLEPLD